MAPARTDRRTLRPYRALAPAYDVLSLEHLLYRAGRKAAVHAVHVKAGQQVLDVACGTGLTMPLIAQCVGPAGHVIGIDASRAMLAQASKRHIAARQTLIQADAQHLCPGTLTDRGVTGPIEAVLFCYALSVMPDWTRVWENVIPLLAPGARVATADVAPPTRGGPPARFIARTLARIGRSNIDSHPWKALQEDCTHVEHHTYAGGHVRVWAGNLP